MKTLPLLLLLLKCIEALPRVDPLVETPSGLIRGLQSQDGDYAKFLGVPYAVVDENNPFSAATPHPGFNHTFEAYHDSITCPQYTNNAAMGTIQCLQLNLYVPNSANSLHTLPVMVYLHGGAFVRGQKTELDLSPKFLVRHDVIVVTFNYRVGPYGFLCVSEAEYNNQGLKDQLLALQWVKDNVAAFGGDVNRITAFGQSAGAMTLDIQLLGTEGLVNRAIIQSGSALTTWMATEKDDSLLLYVADRLGYDGDDLKEAINFLSTVDPLEVIETANEVMIFGHGHPRTRPCVEGKGDDVILEDFPINLQPKVKGMDIMIGHTNKEAKFMYADDSNKEFYRNYDFEEELSFIFEEIPDVDTVRHFYIGDKVLNEDLQSVILDYGSDLAFNYPATRSVDRYVKAGAKNVFRYMFSYEGGRNKHKILRNFTADGASHGDDTSYLFDSSMFKDTPPSEEDQKIIDALTTMWTNFAKYGDPTPSLSDATPVKWRPAEQSQRPYLNIDKQITLESRAFHDRMAFWDVYYKLYADKIKGYRGDGSE
ncbi:hypothetical protein PYW07_012850 [Mythimna separata]|uniref:Carboxylesterase type B domain-containing protein n=1 Tax=Mythimna separata TaxID=271217 RepID=A0AAD7Y9E2_MYTSE|nr:hypothetical protein PYW07_012850 [Mythimna separata]